MNTPANTPANNNWYQQPWIWFVIGLLAVTMLASFAMLFVAMTNAPDLVIEDYANIDAQTERTRAQDQQAVSLNLSAVVRVTEDKLQVELSGNDAASWPDSITVRTRNSTLAELDSEAVFYGNKGVYNGILTLPGNGYDLIIESADSSWRLTKKMFGGASLINLEAYRPGS